jgi:uncharacterized protein
VQITQGFDLAHSIETVWQALADVRLVAACLPGAAVTEELGDGRYRGSFQVRLGPITASFAGEVGIVLRAAEHTATVTGKGTDPRTGSRGSGSMTCRLVALDAGATRVEAVATLDLAGALAQFGKGAVIQEIAGRITRSFADNLGARLAEVRPDATPAAAPMDAGRMVWSVLGAKVLAWLRRVFGRTARV